MIDISKPTVKRLHDQAILSATITSDAVDVPEQLWFSVPADYHHLLSSRLEPFVAAISSLAATTRQDINVDGELCDRFSLGFQDYWDIINSWYPRYISIKINSAQRRSTRNLSNSGAAAAAFSGGVDSFFTQYLLSQKDSAAKLKYAVFIHGLDIPLADHDTFAHAAAAYESELAKLGVDLVTVKSNVRDFIPAYNWGMGHGSGLIGVALALGGGINRFFVPSSKSYATLEPWGSDPVLDHLLSTDYLQVIHHGAKYSRFEKLNVMKDWAPLQGLLRTCYEKPEAFMNCGRCANCRRTMLALASVGVLHKFKTFPAVPLHTYLHCRWETPHERLFGRQSVASAWQHNRLLSMAGQLSLLASPLYRTVGFIKRRTRATRRLIASCLSQ